MAWAEPQDILDSWIGDDAPDDEAKLALWIARAERLIRATIPNIEERITSGDEPDLADNVKDVIVSMVTRVFRNPRGYRTTSGGLTTGPFTDNSSITFGGDNPGALELLDDEKKLLGGEAGATGDAFDVDLLVGYEGFSRGPHWWLELGKGSEW